TVALLPDRTAFAAGERDDRIPGDARQDRAEGRCRHRAIVEDEEDVHAAELLDPAMLGSVEEHDLIAALLDRLGLGEQAGGVIAAAFGRAGAPFGRASVSVAEPHGDSLGPALEIGADRAGDQE